jgi:hypothetical protein
MTKEVENQDAVLVALRTAHRAVRDLLDSAEFQAWVGPNTEVEQTVSELRTARSTLQELRVGRAFELAAEENQRRLASAPAGE